MQHFPFPEKIHQADKFNNQKVEILTTSIT